VTSQAAAPKTTELLGSIPLYFEQNRGQAPNQVDYIARAAGRNILVSPTHADMLVPGGAVRMSPEGAHSVRPESLDPLRAQVNYLLGTNRDQWITHVSTWQRVRYPGVYPGIDLIYHGTGAQLEYDFVVAPDADPSAIRLRIDGSQPVRLDASGDAVLQAGGSAIHLRAPTLYQEIDGARQPVEGRYRVDADNALSFAIGAYDHARALVIDPVIVWAGTIGSSSAITYSQGGIVVDGDGNSYVGGSGGPPNVPSSVPQHPLIMLGQGSTPFVAKLDPGGTLLWISYVHGSSHIAVDSTRAVWAVDGGAGDKLSPAGDAIIGNFALFDSATAIAIDGNDNVYIGGRTTVFKLTPNAAVIYDTTLLSQSAGQIVALALDSSANVYIAGETNSAFAGVPSIGTPPSSSQGSAFAARLKPDGSGLMWAAYVAGVGTAIAASQDNNIWLAGYTTSTNLPVTPGAFSSSNAGGYDGFIAKVDNAGTAFSVLSYLGGQRGDFPGFLAVSSDNSVFIAGSSQSADFPTVNPITTPPQAESLSLLATIDGGVTWHQADASLPGIALDISADPSPGTLVSATDSGLYRSTNNGATWQQRFAGHFLSDHSDRPFFMRDPLNPSVLWLGGGFVQRSEDGGMNWSPAGSFPAVDFGPVPGDPNTAYGITSSGQLYQWMYTGGSPTWNLNFIQVANGFTQFSNVRVGLDGVLYVLGPALFKNDAQGAFGHWSGAGLAGSTNPPYQTSLGVSATNASVIYAAIGGKLYRTADAGAHWSTGTQSSAGAIARITVAPSNDLAVWAVTGPDQSCGTATLTKNGGQTWTAPFAGLAGVCVIAIAVSPADPNTAWAVATPKTFGFLGRMTADGTAFQYSTLLPDVPLGFATNGSDAFLTGSTTPGQFTLAGGAIATGSPQYAALFVERIGAAGQMFCSYSVLPSSLYAWTPSTALSINVTAASGCAWTLSGLPSWLSVTSATAGSGNGAVTLTAASNATGETRTATLSIAGQTVTVTQPAASCIYFLTPVVSAIGAAGGVLQITLSVDQGCPWTITNESPSSLTVQSPASGSGVTVVQVLASANPSPSAARQLRFDVATSPAIISEAAGNCSYALSFDSPADGPVLGPQAQGSLVHVVTGSACSWKALGNALWINPGSGATGQGNGSVQVALSANATGITRSGGVVVGDQVLQITQNAASLGTWVLNASVYPAGAGSVAVAPLPAADGTYSTGTRVCLTTSANAGWIFSAWTGDPLLDSSNCAVMTGNLNVTANFLAAPPSAALNFVPLAPCRIADTRDANGPFGGPFIVGQAVRDFVIPNSDCGIPASAQAYSLNVAVVPRGPLGYLTVWPAGQAQPVVATLNSTDGRIKSNAAIVPAGAAGAISLFVTDPADVVLDINGYFVLASEPGSLQFYPLTPCRVADTRDAPGPFGGPGIAAGGSRTFPIPASQCNIPASAQAYSFNFAAVPKEPLYLTAWPNGQAMPLVASLNAAHLVATSNAVIVPAGTGGSVDVFASGATDLVIDINGYFAPPGAGGLSLYNLQPCRVTDTRNPAGSPPFNGAIDIDPTASGCGTLSTAQAYVFNATVVPPGPLGYLTLWPQGTVQPLVASLNATEGAITGNMAIVPTGNGSISAFGSQPTHLVLDIFGYFAP